MRALVTGGCGFIGSHIVETLLKSPGNTVTVIDDESAPQNDTFYRFSERDFQFSEGSRVSYYKEDVNDPSLRDLFEGVDVVFHHAARSRIQPSFDNPRETYVNNVMGTQSVLDNCVAHGVRRVVYAGSSSCYGLTNSPPMVESMSPDCLNHYGLSKYQGEQVCKMYSKLHGLETVVLRYFNVYGPREPLKGIYAPVIGIFKRQRDQGIPLTIVGDGKQRRDFTHVSDVVKANLLVSSLPTSDVFRDSPYEKFTVFNIGSGKNYSVQEIADSIDSNQSYVPTRPGEARETLADVSRAKRILGWSPKVNVMDVINSY